MEMAESSEWQNSITSFTEAALYMFDNNLHTDCSFFVGKGKSRKELKSHSFVLMGASRVFERMFVGKVPQNISEINEPDFEPYHFNQFLRVLYMDEYMPESFEEACNLYYIADKYLVQRVMDLCLSYILENVNIDNAIDAYHFFSLFGLNDSAKNCEQMIEKQTSVVISSKNFANIEKSTLLMVIKKDHLNIKSEKELYDAAVRWIEAEIIRKGIVKEDEKEALYLQILSHIRFFSMAGKDFASGPALNPYLSKDDRLAICQKMLNNDLELGCSPTICLKKRVFTVNKEGAEDLQLPLPEDWVDQLWDAVEYDDVDLLEKLKLGGADLSIRDDDGWSLLHRAVYECSLDVTRWLLDDGSVNIDWVTTRNYRYVHEGSTALHMAASGGRLEIARFLVDAGADTHIRDWSGRTPLNIAEGHPAVAGLIRHKGRF